MLFKRSLFGYSKKEVADRVESYENLIEIQRRDIEYLKKDNNLLKSTIARMSNEKDAD